MLYNRRPLHTIPFFQLFLTAGVIATTGFSQPDLAVRFVFRNQIGVMADPWQPFIYLRFMCIEGVYFLIIYCVDVDGNIWLEGIGV